MNDRLLLFAPAHRRPFAERVAAELGVALAPLEERTFEDGEHKTRPLVSVRGADVVILDSLFGAVGPSTSDRLVRLLLLCATMRDHGAARLTVVTTYLCYARKDRRTKLRDPVNLRTVAQLLEAVGAQRLVALEAHNLQAFDNAFRIPTVHLEAWPALVDPVVGALGGRPAVVVSPDLGGIARADRLAAALGPRLGTDLRVAFVEKRRSAGVVTGGALVGDVSGRVAVLVDDLVSTGTTLVRAAEACLAGGASAAFAVAAHGLFGEGAAEKLAEAPLERLVVTDSVDPARPPPRVEVVSVAGPIARAIDRLHRDEALSDG